MPKDKVSKTFLIPKEHAKMFQELTIQDRRTGVEVLKLLIEQEHKRREEGEK